MYKNNHGVPAGLLMPLMERDGQRFAGLHLTVDLYDAHRLNDIEYIEQVIRECVAVCGASLLNIDLHHFTPTHGVAGVAVLAESHMSIHTWPELDYAAVDIFMCGQAEPERAVPLLEQAFNAGEVEVKHLQRGTRLAERLAQAATT